MKLSGAGFRAVEEALLDSFRDIDSLKPVARELNSDLQDITAADRLPTVVFNLIEYAEAHDQVGELIDAARLQNPSNLKLTNLKVADLKPAPSTAAVVDGGGGATPFKQRLKDSLGELDDVGMQLVAANELSRLLDDASDDEAETLYLALLGNVKTDRPDAVVGVLAPVVAACLRRRFGGAQRPLGINLDLARARLRKIDLSGLDLHEADVAFADLRHSNLDNANLQRTRGYAVDVTKAGVSGSNLEEARWHLCVARGTRFHNCRMVSVFLKGADLTAAEFQQSRLQGAHFERADLTGARFERADLADAFFTGAKIDDAAAATISRALHWQQAHFDPAAQALIAQKAGS